MHRSERRRKKERKMNHFFLFALSLSFSLSPLPHLRPTSVARGWLLAATPDIEIEGERRELK